VRKIVLHLRFTAKYYITYVESIRLFENWKCFGHQVKVREASHLPNIDCTFSSTNRKRKPWPKCWACICTSEFFYFWYTGLSTKSEN